jgi:hypothetical protein
MNIAVLILSRGRPAGLVAAIQSLHATASGDHPVQYVVCGDDDDPTMEQAQELLGYIPVTWSINPRPDALGRAWNLGAQAAGAWDLALFTGDDTVPCTWHWDARMAQSAGHSAGAFAWTEANDPENCTYWVTTRGWHDAVGAACPELFPYWFNDTWVAEQHLFAFEAPIPVDRGLVMGGRRGTTREMREVSFWFQVFAATRHMRIAEAARIARAYGREPPDPAPMLAWCRGWDEAQQASVPRYNTAFAADTVPPTPRYLRLRAQAERLLVRVSDPIPVTV